MPDPAAGISVPVSVLAELASAVALAQQVQDEGLGPVESATYVGVAPSKWRQMNADELCPKAVELGDRCQRWPRSELRAWLLAGAPPRARWTGMRDQALRRAQ